MTNTNDLRAMRRKLRLTLRQAAAKIGGISPSTIWGAENGLHEIGSIKQARILNYYQTELEKGENNDD